MKIHILCSALLGLVLSGNALADKVVVVVNSANAATLSRSDVRNIFLGRTKSFPDGTPATPIALKEGSHTRELFNESILKKDETQLRSYWVELIFTGKALPPREVETEQELRDLVARNPGYIGYVDEKMMGNGLKPVPIQ